MPYNINIDIYSETLTKVDGKFINKFPVGDGSSHVFIVIIPQPIPKYMTLNKKALKPTHIMFMSVLNVVNYS